ncbi:MAG: nitrilase-related carbon-nitrogen hydrolase [Prevotella sp.]
MKITIIQSNPHWTAYRSNASEMEKIISSAADSDLYILPEMWNTGFVVDTNSIPSEMADYSLAWMLETAKKSNAAICGSIAVKIDNDDKNGSNGGCTYRNRLYFVKPDGTYSYYDKRHLFSHGGENNMFTAGNTRTVVEWRGWRFLLLICYDLRFPIWARYNNDYDAIITVANWPEQRISAWDILTKARAIENQCFFIGCNRTGYDKSNNFYPGHSCIINPEGINIATGQGDGQLTVSACIDKTALNEYRQSFNTLNDRDNK